MNKRGMFKSFLLEMKEKMVSNKMNKKGMFFTLLVITLLSLFLVSFTVYSYLDDREPIKNRINTMNDYIYSIEENLERQVYIAGFRTIFLLEKEITETGNYISNINDSFSECFFNGTINGVQQNLMDDAKFTFITSFISEKAKEINVNVNFSNSRVQITQIDPWNVKILFISDIFITDLSNLSFWNRTILISTKIPIENFEDPLYFVETNGLATNKINKTPYEVFSVGGDNTNLSDHLANSYYKTSTTAPDFISRMQGDLTASENGIESLVNLEKLSSLGVPVKDKTIVDYIYFSNNDPVTNNVPGMAAWVKLDAPHYSVYVT